MNTNKTYLGDSVYVAWDGYDVALSTENGICCTNKIILEPHVMRGLMDWLARQEQETKQALELPDEAYDPDNFRDLGGIGIEPH